MSQARAFDVIVIGGGAAGLFCAMEAGKRGRRVAVLESNDRLGKKEYRDVYMDLNGAASADSKVFIQDPGADGLKAKRDENQPFDIVEIGGKQTMFNSDWKAQKLSEQDYQKVFADADDRYAKILAALLAQVKKTS